MTDDLRERVRAFERLELPGQPQGMHMGTSYLVSDLWQEIERLRAENDVLKAAPESALSIEQLRAERAVGFREGYEAAMKGRP